MARSSNPLWYRNRGYVHFDAPMDARTAAELVTSETNVARHAFRPLVAFNAVERRWSRREAKWKTKRRPIAYAAHADAHIFAYYSIKIGVLYDALLTREGLSHAVLAYRKQQDRNDPTRGMASFDFAADAFADLASRQESEAVAIDIKSFFDTIPHRQLKQSWKEVLGVRELPADHYAVFKAATRFATVPLRQICRALGVGRKRLKLRRSFDLDRATFAALIRDTGLLNVNSAPRRIPQGLPISGLLANIAMLNVDRAMVKAALAVGGTYRRYSDDILLIGPAGQTARLEELLAVELAALQLEIQSKKTVRSSGVRASDGTLTVTPPLQYLGLVFDGSSVRLRPQTLVRFEKRMKRAVRRARNAARKSTAKGEPIRIRRRKLYARFSHLRPHRETPIANRPRSSFVRYANLAAAPSDRAGMVFGFKSQIRRQLRRQWKRLQRLIAEAESNSFGTRGTPRAENE